MVVRVGIGSNAKTSACHVPPIHHAPHAHTMYPTQARSAVVVPSKQIRIHDSELLSDWQRRRAEYKARKRLGGAREKDTMAKLSQFTAKLRSGGGDGGGGAGGEGRGDEVCWVYALQGGEGGGAWGCRVHGGVGCAWIHTILHLYTLLHTFTHPCTWTPPPTWVPLHH